jgi:hypothetical protein
MPKRLLDSSGQFLKGIGTPLGNAKLRLNPQGKCSYWLGVMKNPGKRPSDNRRQVRIAQRLMAKTWQFPSLFSAAQCFCFLSIDNRRSCGKLIEVRRYREVFDSLVVLILDVTIKL